MSDDLMNFILCKITDQHKTMGGLTCLLQLRPVCKAWRVACTGYTGELSVYVYKSTDLPQLCKILPELSAVSILYAAAPSTCSLTPLSSLSRLSSLKFTESLYPLSDEEEKTCEPKSVPLFNLAPLPSSIRALELDVSAVDTRCYQHISFTNLTRLDCSYQGPASSRPAQLLQYLPLLQVTFPQPC